MEGEPMKTTRSRSAAAMISLAMTVALGGATQNPPTPKADCSLMGTWRLESALFGGKPFSPPEGSTTLKHITPTHFTWVTYGADGTIARTAGGTYTVVGDTYQENPDYGIGPDFAVVKSRAQKFTCKVDGDKWYHTGALSNGLTIEEVWQRQTRKE
jgi:hypothetical protein